MELALVFCVIFLRTPIGAVDVWSLFLQRGVGHLNKEESAECSGSTAKDSNAVEMPNRRCPEGPAQRLLLFVEHFSFRWLNHEALALTKSLWTRAKLNLQTPAAPDALLNHFSGDSRFNRERSL